VLGWSAGYTELQLAAARGCGQPGSVVRTGTQAADDVGARIADDVAARIFGLGDATVAGGLSLVHTYPPYGALVQSRISGPGRARARPWLEVRLADASPLDGVQDTAATTGGRAGVQQVKHGCDHWRVQQVKPRI